MEPLGTQLRRQRRRLALSLDDVSRLTGISKPYLSLVETNKARPPSDEKIRRLEATLKFPAGALLVHAHLARTPDDVRQMLQRLLAGNPPGAALPMPLPPLAPQNHDNPGEASPNEPSVSVSSPGASPPSARHSRPLTSPAHPAAPSRTPRTDRIGIDLDAAYFSGALQSLAEERGGNITRIGVRQTPLINKVSAGYPRDFTDLDYPARVADEYVPTPDPARESEPDAGPHSGARSGRDRRPDTGDPHLFAARVNGSSMSPRYLDGDVVIFSPAVDPKSGDDCFVRLDTGQTTFKRVFFDPPLAPPSPPSPPSVPPGREDQARTPTPSADPADPGDAGETQVRLVPLNPAYRTRTYPARRVAGVYKAVWVVRPVSTQT